MPDTQALSQCFEAQSLGEVLREGVGRGLFHSRA